MEYEIDKNGEFATYLDMLSNVDMVKDILRVFGEEGAKKEREMREKYMASQAVQMKRAEFSEAAINKYNINKDTLNHYYYVVDKDGNKLMDMLFYLGGLSYSDFYGLTKEWNNYNKRYIVLQFVVPKKFTKEEKKKYTYLKGDYRFEHHYCIIDKINLVGVWSDDNRFGTSPILYDNVMLHNGVYIYLPTMKVLVTKDYCSYTTIITKHHIILGKFYGENDAKIIDRFSGEVTDID